MFRPFKSSLPEDPEFPHNLTKLGYFINSEDQIRFIGDPSKPFQYYINKNERYNEKHKEAMNSCIRDLVAARFAHMDPLPLTVRHLPLSAPSGTPQIPILTTPNLKDCLDILVIIPSSSCDFTIPSYRHVSRASVNDGSFLSLIETYLSLDCTSPFSKGVILANPGQLLYNRRRRIALTHASWYALPRRSPVLPPPRIDEVKNRAPGHETPAAHVASVFEAILNPDMVNAKIKLEIIADGDGGEAVVHYLSKNWTRWSHQVRAIALTNPLHYTSELIHSNDFLEFLEKRGRAWSMDPRPRGQQLPALDGGKEGLGIGCPLVSAGSAEFTEMVVLDAWNGAGGMLDFFKEVREIGDEFQNLGINAEGVEDEEPVMGLVEIKGDE